MVTGREQRQRQAAAGIGWRSNRRGARWTAKAGATPWEGKARGRGTRGTTLENLITSSSSLWTIVLPSSLEMGTFQWNILLHTTPTSLLGSPCTALSTKKALLWPPSMKELYQEWWTLQAPHRTSSTNNQCTLQLPTCSTIMDQCQCHIIQLCPITNLTWFPTALLLSIRTSWYHSMPASPRVKLPNSCNLLLGRRSPTQSPLSLPRLSGNLAIPRCSNIASTSSSNLHSWWLTVALQLLILILCWLQSRCRSNRWKIRGR